MRRSAAQAHVWTPRRALRAGAKRRRERSRVAPCQGFCVLSDHIDIGRRYPSAQRALEAGPGQGFKLLQSVWVAGRVLGAPFQAVQGAPKIFALARA